MINEDNKIEMIELYIRGELHGEMLAAFEKRLQEDTEFRELVALEKEVLEGLDRLGIDEQTMTALQQDLDEIHTVETHPGSDYAAMRNRFREIHDELEAHHRGEEVKIVPLSKRYWQIAATVALLIVSGIVIFIILRQPEQPTLAYHKVQEIDSNGNPVVSRDLEDSLQVMIYPPTETYTYHYQLTGHLALYGPFKQNNLQILYNPDDDQYFLKINDIQYPLQKLDKIIPLK